MKKFLPSFLFAALVFLFNHHAFSQDYNHSTDPITTCSGNYYDGGGPGGNYPNQNGNSVFKTFSSSNGNRLKFNFQQFVLENGVDYLTVYDGPTNAYPILGQFTGNLAPFSVQSTGSIITFSFYSNFQTTFAGWAATIECTTAPLPVFNMSTGTTNGCSGMFYDNGGAGAIYPNFENRTQTFCSGNGQKLVATFNPLVTEFGSGDSLWAYDGNSTSSPLLAIFVAGSTLETLTSTGTCLTFRFKSDGTGSGRGWAAELSCTFASPALPVFAQSTGLRATCNGIFTDDGGESGNYANLSGGTKVQSFTSYNGNRLKINFQQFVTENGVDVLRVYDGPTTSHPLIGVYSGNLAPFSLEATGANLTFAFYSNFQTSFAGWRGTFECTTSILPVYNMSSGTTTTCSGMFYDNAGANVAYPNFENRTQTFCSGSTQRMLATFNPLETEFNAGDTLWAYDGNSTASPLLGVYVSGSSIETLTSTGSCLTFRFKTDGNNQGRGWAALLSCTATAPATTTFAQSSGVRYVCDGIFTDDGGENGNYANLSGGTRTQTFASYNGNRLKINFQQFVTESGVDVLRVYDGPTTAYPLIGVYSGNLAPFFIESSGRSLTFAFYSNFQTSFAGWRGTFECTTPILNVYNLSSGTVNACSGMFYDNGGANGNYPNFENRIQTFCSDNGQKIQFEFNPLAYLVSGGDTLWVYDGNSVSANPLAILVAGSNVETLTSSATCLTFRFKSVANPVSGWAAQFSCVAAPPTQVVYALSSGVRYVCSGLFTDDGGASNNYNNLSGGTKTQTFSSYNGNRIKINFQQFITQSGTDYLQIYDGTGTNSPLIGTYTGNLAPFFIESTGSSLTFRFYSDFQTSFAGWQGTFECTSPVLPVYNMSSGTTNSCSGVFYDAAGSRANYAQFENRTQTFCSSNSQKVQFNFNQLAFGIQSGDSLWVYDGNSANSPLVGIYVLSSNVETLTSSGTCLTFRFKSGATSTLQGWQAILSCVSEAPTSTIFPLSSGVRVVCTGVFTDDGGLNGNYSNLSGGTKTQTFHSATGGRLSVVFNSFSMETNVDYLDIFDGPNSNFPRLARLTGTIASGSTYTSTGSQLTFVMYSNFQTTFGGWVANFACSGPALTTYNMLSGTVNTCSGVFYDNGGGGNVYPNNENRIQTFCSDNGQRIVFDFTNFNLNSSDSLLVFDGNSVSAPLIGVYLNSYLPEKITSAGTCLTFRFKSDASGQVEGWKALISCSSEAPTPQVYAMNSGIRATCSGVFTDDGGLTANYSNSQNRVMTLQGYNGQRIKLNFQSFSLENGPDYLRIYDGPNTNSPLLGNFSGTNSPGIITSSGSTLTFWFVSDNSATGNWVASIECAGPALTPYNMSSGTVNTCSGVFYDAGGVSSNYLPNESRIQTFCSDNGQKIQFNFNNLAFLMADSLWAYDGNSVASPLIGIFVNGSRVEPITSSGTCLTFRFKSDNSAENAGWAAAISCVSAPPSPMVYHMSSGLRVACSGVFTDAAGPSANYANNQSLTQTFQSPNNTRLQFEFTQFSMENGPDYLDVYDGPTTAYPYLGRFSGTTNPGTIISSGNSITFFFRSDVSAVSSGWIANISCAGPVLPSYNMSTTSITACEGMWYDNSGPGKNYIGGQNTNQTFCSGSNKRLMFTFNASEFVLSGNDTLFVYDGNSTSSPLIGAYVGGKIEPIISSGNCITFRFKGLNINGSTGWAAYFTCTDNPPQPEIYTIRLGTRGACSGIFTDEAGPSANYGNNMNRTMVFYSNSLGARLQFNFNQFSTETGVDVLRIYDGPNINSPLIGTYSGTNSPGVVTSTGSSLTFRWTTDVSAVSTGWIASIACVSNVPLVGTLAQGPFCAGANIQIPFTSPDQNSGNVFTAQLSDANGTFTNPTTLGTLSGTTSGIISGILPGSLTSSGNFRIRILGSSPANAGSGSSPISIFALPGNLLPIFGLNSLCAGSQNVTYSVSNVSNATAFNWTVPSGSTIVSGQGTNSLVVNFGTNSGNISCQAVNACGNSNMVSLAINVTPATTPTVSISSNATNNTVCNGGNVLFTSIVAAGSNPQFQWILNGVDVEGATSSTFTLNNLVGNASVSLRIMSNSNCYFPAIVTSSPVSITVQSSVVPSATVSTSAPGNSACSGTLVNFTSSLLNQGTNSALQWKINGNSVLGATNSTFSTTTLQNGDVVSLQLTSNATCAFPATVSSNGITMIVNQTVTPTVSISSNTGGNQVCSGNVLILNANSANGGDSPQYQWFQNGSSIPGESGLSYTIPSGLTGSQNFSVRLTSNAICATQAQVTSANFTVTGVSSVVPSVSIASNVPGGPICVGTSITFTASPTNGGSNPGYQWRVNGNPVSGQTGSTFTTSSLSNNDQVTVVLTSNDPCASPLSATSSAVTVNLVTSILPTVTASSSIPSNSICAGQSITFTANPTNGGSNPGYVWRINGNAVSGQTGSTFTTSSLTNGQQVSVQLTSSFGCASPQTVSSTAISVTVNPLVSPSVSVSSSQGTSICQGSNTTLTANPSNGGPNPAYQWFVDGILINGATSATYSTPTNLSNSVIYTVQLTSNAACVNPVSVTSQNFTLTISPSVTPTIGFSSSVAGNTICSGQSITFTANSTNGGATPGYQWRINNADVPGQTGSTFTSTTLANNDQVSVRLTSNASCANPTSVTAPNQTITVTPSSPAAVSVTSNVVNNTICPSQSITFTANPVNGGSNPTYQWKLNGNNINGETNPTYTTFGLANNDQISVQITSNSSCANPVIGTSAPVTVTVNQAVTPTVGISSNPTGTTFCSGTTIQFTAGPVNGGNNPGYQWQVNGNSVPNQTGSTFNLNITGPSTVTVVLTSNALCASPATVTSSGVVLAVTPPPAVFAQSDTAVCEATGSFALSATPAGGTWTGNGVSSSGTFSPGAPGNYWAFYQYTDPNSSCTGKDSVKVLVKARPVINIPAVQPLCATADPIQLTATPVGGTWSGTGVLVNGLFNPATAGPGQQVITYTVSQNGCQASKILVVNVTAPPTVDVGGAETVCFATQEVQFVGIPSGGTWTGNGVNGSGLFTPGFVTPNTTVTLTYSVTVNGCTVAKTKQVTVSINPATVNAGADQTVCLADGPFVLQGVVGAGGTWSGTGVSANGLFNPATSGVGTFTLTYTVTFIQSPTCQGSDSKVVTVISSPNAPAVLGDTICRLGTGILTANGVAGQFRWFTTETGGTPIAGQTGPIFNTPVLNASTTYYVSQVAGTCESPRTPVTAFVNTFNNAAFSIMPGPPQSLSANPPNAQFYQWLLSGNVINGANQNIYSPLSTGDYSVIIGLDGCRDTSAVQFVIVTDVAQTLNRSAWKVFPNPVQRDLMIEGEGIEQVRVMDVLGRTTQAPMKALDDLLKMDFSDLPNGIYFVELKGQIRVEKVKVVVRR